MDSIRVCAAALLCMVAAVCLRTLRAEYATLLRFAFCILFGTMVLLALRPLAEQLRAWLDGTAPAHTETLFRALGIALLTHMTAELCRDCGEGTVAGWVETLGKLEILGLCLPLIGAVMETVGEILRW